MDGMSYTSLWMKYVNINQNRIAICSRGSHRIVTWHGHAKQQFVTLSIADKNRYMTHATVSTNDGNSFYISVAYSENARCVCEMTVNRTRLCYWIARLAKPGVQSSNTCRVRFTVISHTPVRSRFYHIHILYKRNWDGFWLMNLTQKSYS